MKIGIFGGSFSPPHIGHTISAETAVSQLSLDKLIVVPLGTPPHKTPLPDGPAPRQRFEMTRLAFGPVPNAEVSDIELCRPGESYTVDTVRELRALYPNDELYLITGTDMFLTLRGWKGADELLQNVTPAVTGRSNGRREDVKTETALLAERGVSVVFIENEMIDISSSELRGLLPKRTKPWHIDEGVYSYIIENSLYGARADFDWLRLRAYRMLKDSRVRHVAGCEEAAVSLAKRWGVDENEAREAAILHDITKKLTLDEQLELCDEFGIEADEIERESDKLLHSKTAAAFAEKHFAASADVYRAIFWHTTGRADMTPLEKIIYMADYIEPNRAFEGVEKMRKLAYVDLDRALLMGMEMSLDDLVSRGITPHCTTLEAAEFLRKGINR